MNLLATEGLHYSLKTLRALHNGAADSHNTVRLLVTDDDIGCAHATLVFVGTAGLCIRLDNGSTKSGIGAARVLHAEVV